MLTKGIYKAASYANEMIVAQIKCLGGNFVLRGAIRNPCGMLVLTRWSADGKNLLHGATFNIGEKLK